MSEFQLSLLVIGALAVVAVFAYNKWQEHRAARLADESFKSQHPDVLIDEPSPVVRNFDSGNEGEPERIEPSAGIRPTVAAAKDAREPSIPDGRIDYVIELAGEAAPNSTSIAELWSVIEQRFAPQARLAGLVEGTWVPMPAGTSTTQLEAALQLVSRQGVLGEGELLEFRSAIETMAAKLQLAARAPEMRDSLEAARVLDGICAEADIQVAFHVVAQPGAAFAGTKVRAAAEAAGFILDSRGRFVLADEQGRELYELGDRNGARFVAGTMKDAAPHALTLSMDVPRVPDTQRTFDAMVRFGRHLAGLLGGSLVDDNNEPLEERAVAAIGTQLAVVRRNLDAQGIAPGSALALRLFS